MPLSASNELKRLARRYFIEIMNQARMATIDEIIADEFVFTLPTHPEPYKGPAGFKVLVNMLHDAFPDFYINPCEMVAEGETVVCRWRGGGTHMGGPLHTSKGDLAASGRYFEIDGMSMLTVRDGKVRGVKANEDTVGMLLQLGVIPGHDATVPAREAQIALVQRYFGELMSEGKTGIIPDIMDPGVTFHIPTQPKPFIGYEAFNGFVAYLRNAFPDIKFTPENFVVDGSKVASRWRITGTHRGEFLGARPTGNTISDHGIDLFTIHQGKILSVEVNENDFGLMQQLGIIPR
jgi:steroid delta-isomerase-like uncharacterized protein